MGTFFKTRNNDTSFACFMFVLAAWVFGGFVMFVGAVFRTRSIHTIFSPGCV